MITGERIAEGDVILALASSGVHSNGFSLVRRIVAKTPALEYHDPSPFCSETGQTLAQALLTPTRLYVQPVLAALKIRDKDGKPAIRGMAHITGGGLDENIPRIIPEDLCAEIDTSLWTLPPVFQWLIKAGNLKPQDIATTLNAGIGMIVVCAAEHAQALKQNFAASGETVFEIGTITPQSATGRKIRLLNSETSWA
jgi:phosphoribosylaminoimidazole synthetase